MENKVLVAIPTNRVKHYCLGKMINAINNLECASEVIFADDTHNLDKNPMGTDSGKYSDIIRKKGFKVIDVLNTKNLPSPPRIRQRLVNSRIELRNYFLMKGDYTHMLFVDSDVVIPYDTIPRLLSAKEDITSGIYWQNDKKKGSYIVVYKYMDNESYKCKLNDLGVPLSVNELIPSRIIGKDNDSIQIAAIGFGCVLISKKVLEDERWQFRWLGSDPSRPTTEDMWWSLDMIDLGYKICCHTGVLCKHHPKPWEGPV